jgi:hypothetical protein
MTKKFRSDFKIFLKSFLLTISIILIIGIFDFYIFRDINYLIKYSLIFTTISILSFLITYFLIFRNRKN